MSRRILAILVSVVIIAVVGGIAVAALLPQPAAIEVEAEIADPYVQFRFWTGSGFTQDQDPLPGSVIAGPGSVLGALTSGELSLTLEDAWAGTEARVAPGADLRLWLVGPPGTEVEITGLDFSAAPGFGDLGSGAPVEVQLLDHAGSAWTFPRVISVPGGVDNVEIALSINEATAENGVTYGPATITVVGEPYTP